MNRTTMMATQGKSFVDMTGWKMSEHGIPRSKLTVQECYMPRGKEQRDICMCECGRIIDVPANHLDTVLSCGCERYSPIAFGKKLIDMTGWKMSEHGVPRSKLTVVSRGPNMILASGQPVVQWQCKCECGNLCLQTAAHLIKGDVLSCGCGRKQGRKKLNKYFGPFTDSNNQQYYIIEASNTGHAFFISAADKNNIDSYTWSEGVAAKMDGSVTHFISAKVDDHNKVLHKMVIDARWVRFEDGNPLNNREENLTPISWTEHMLSRKKSLANKSGVKGVYYDKKKQRWTALIGGVVEKNKQLFLGSFEEKDDAIKARLNAEASFLGENAGQKDLFKQYGIKIPENKQTTK